MTRLLDPAVPTRILEPEPTVGGAPSHSPPDTRYAPGIRVSRSLGWFSVGLGLAELFAPDLMAELTGVRNRTLLQLYGLREFACGVGILYSRRPVGFMWARVLGDALDLATLGSAMVSGRDGDRRRALGAAAAVAGVTAFDTINSLQLTAAARMEG